MKKILLLSLFLMTTLANAGVVKVVTYPVRHPVRSVRSAGRVVFYPVLHPKKSAHQVKRVIW